ncbi:DUF6286 domain-containing protein [Enemella evansiae]|uniref:Alkaline shock response membrane anchor protein AmaP n=1 Tax=Enemella evansiae TaxID=2016499 RepID=A0A255GPY2_9ACTN|nr:DUF6286 domain-containing protein [Enemella evansiae]PFG68953.1 hypothetical protein B0O41_3801 [Propionibacteriaceae bacterium ES.041]OYN96938.1 alkaline shock response membrane anchor protein AmaP [Enemella evansiae]OYO00629.1 alkaline shock response membrane anchor protein AmaP [Enemella evansiae]OYO06220.1 alkaline shock response membrane anchor protein AmaP [Enemella evansiae]OYO11908.1 alkaline shock response membrane anchor protein AmaP [Enemella evansiae]
MSATPRRLSRRPARVIPVTILAVVLVAIGALGAWILGTLLVTGTWPAQAVGPINSTAGTRLDSPAAITAAGVLAVLGLIMVLAAIIPGKRSKVDILGGDVPGETVISDRDLARRIRLRTEQIDGVHSTQAHVSPRRAEVTVRTVVDDVAPVREATRAAAEQAVAELRPTAPMRTQVRVQRMK